MTRYLTAPRIGIALTLCAASLFGAGELSNRRAPGFALMDSSLQRYYDPQDYRGKILLVNFMLTSCPHCLKFSAILEQVAAKYRDRVAVLEVVPSPDNVTTVRNYINAHKVTVPVLFDCGQVTAAYLKATPQNPRIDVPHLFIINAQGWIQNDFAYSPNTAHIFEGRGLFAELDRMLASAPKR
jgi:peroxiredoxin